jgi:hypothetical protein
MVAEVREHSGDRSFVCIITMIASPDGLRRSANAIGIP